MESLQVLKYQNPLTNRNKWILVSAHNSTADDSDAILNGETLYSYIKSLDGARESGRVTRVLNGPAVAYYIYNCMAPNQKWNYSWIRSIPGPDVRFWDQCPPLFIEIPKTGSLSIQRARHPKFSFGHMYGRWFPSKARSKLRTIVRNPYDRLVSAYHFMIRGGFRNNRNYLHIRDEYKNFEDWVLNGLTEEFTVWNPHYQDMEPTIAQVEWVCNEDYELIIDPQNIGHFENFLEDAKRLLGICQGQIPHINKSRDRKHWKEYYTNKAVEDRVYRLYELDFTLLGYERYKPS